MPVELPWQLKLLYDGKCPLCSREVAVLRRRDRENRLAFEDITDPAFDPSRYGLTLPDVVGAMHAVRPDGSVVKGIDVFAEAYEAVGWTWLAKPMRWRLTRPIAKASYRIFARLRPGLSRFNPNSCEQGTCAVKQ